MTVGIGNTLKQLRIERKLTQKELAAKVSGGVDYTYIGKIEREEQLPSLKILLKLAEALAIPLSSFFSEENEQTAAFIRPGKLVDLDATREKSLLIKELNLLHRGDIPLLVEIIRALNRHRKSGKNNDYPLPGNELSLVAEEGPDYKDND